VIGSCSGPAAVEVTVELMSPEAMSSGKKVRQGIFNRPGIGASDRPSLRTIAGGKQSAFADTGQAGESGEGMRQVALRDRQLFTHGDRGTVVVYSEDKERHSRIRVSASNLWPAVSIA